MNYDGDSTPISSAEPLDIILFFIKLVKFFEKDEDLWGYVGEKICLDSSLLLHKSALERMNANIRQLNIEISF